MQHMKLLCHRINRMRGNKSCRRSEQFLWPRDKIRMLRAASVLLAERKGQRIIRGGLLSDDVRLHSASLSPVSIPQHPRAAFLAPASSLPLPISALCSQISPHRKRATGTDLVCSPKILATQIMFPHVASAQVFTASDPGSCGCLLRPAELWALSLHEASMARRASRWTLPARGHFPAFFSGSCSTDCRGFHVNT